MTGRYALFLNRATSASPCQHLQERISTLVTSGEDYKALSLFQKLQDQIPLDHSLSLYILKACINLSLLRPAKLLHDQILRYGISIDGLIGNSLITLYARCGSLDEGQRMFDLLQNRSSVSWSALIGGYVQHGHSHKAIEIFDEMQYKGLCLNRSILLSILKACGSICGILKGMILHHEIIVEGSKYGYGDVVTVVESALLDMYAKCGCLDEAQKVFDSLPDADVIAWNTLLSGYSRHDEGHQVLIIYQEMQRNGIKPTKPTFLCVLKACCFLSATEEGKVVHDHMMKTLVFMDEILVNSLINTYANCGWLNEARKMFDMTHPFPNKGMWGVMIGGYVQHGHNLIALSLFDRMPKHFRTSDQDVYPSLLKACGNLKASIEGAVIHDLIVRNLAEESNVILESALIDMYCKCGFLDEARVVFNKIGNRNVVSWGSMISGYVEHGCGLIALNLFEDMENEGISPNRTLFLSCMKACASSSDIDKGRCQHNSIVLLGLDSDATIGSAIIDMYAKCGGTQDAIHCFENMETRDVVCWNAMMTGYVHDGFAYNALKLFWKMQREEVKPDEVSILSVLQACGQIGAISHGRMVHYVAIETNLTSETVIGRSLVDMYARCGSLEEAQKVLYALTQQDLISWSSLIAGYAESGNCEMIRKCLEMMLEHGLKPDCKTFSSLLCACAHAGKVAEGYKYFEAMKPEYNVTPSIEHFNSMIGLLAHVGCLEEATKMIDTMPISPDTTGWMSLIVACRNYGSFEIGRGCFDEVAQPQ